MLCHSAAGFVQIVMFSKKLKKHGSKYVLVIEDAILELLGIDDNTLLQISILDGSSLVVTPLKGEADRKLFTTSMKKLNKKYNRTLKRLAE